MLGTVVKINTGSSEMDVMMKPPGLDSIRRFQPVHLRKMNKFSINQIVKIRSDWSTIREIDEEFGQMHLREEKV